MDDDDDDDDDDDHNNNNNNNNNSNSNSNNNNNHIPWHSMKSKNHLYIVFWDVWMCHPKRRPQNQRFEDQHTNFWAESWKYSFMNAPAEFSQKWKNNIKVIQKSYKAHSSNPFIYLVFFTDSFICRVWALEFEFVLFPINSPPNHLNHHRWHGQNGHCQVLLTWHEASVAVAEVSLSHRLEAWHELTTSSYIIVGWWFTGW